MATQTPPTGWWADRQVLAAFPSTAVSPAVFAA